MREPTEEDVAALRGAIAANNRSGGYFSDSIFKSYLAEALLMRREIAGAEAALQDAFAFVDLRQRITIYLYQQDVSFDRLPPHLEAVRN